MFDGAEHDHEHERRRSRSTKPSCAFLEQWLSEAVSDLEDQFVERRGTAFGPTAPDRRVRCRRAVLLVRWLRRELGEPPRLLLHDDGTPARIACAAIQHFDGRIFWARRPARHHDVIRAMTALNAYIGQNAQNRHTQGFLTQHGRFVTRTEAAAIARAAGQVRTRTDVFNALFSEDVW